MISFADPTNELLKALSPWDALSITEKNGELLIVLNENRVTSDIFYSVIDTGFCIPAWLDEKKAVENIKKVTVLNKHSHQGYILTNGVESCNERADKKNKESKLLLAFRTSLY